MTEIEHMRLRGLTWEQISKQYKTTAYSVSSGLEQSLEEEKHQLIKEQE
jgi:hypothetical protein